MVLSFLDSPFVISIHIRRIEMYKKFKLKFILWDFYRTGSKNVKVLWTKGFRTFILFVVPLYLINSNNYRFYYSLLIER